MTYVVPQVLVFQELQLVPAAQIQQLPAHIAGGHAHLIRYDEENEKPFGRLGQYDRLIDTTYSWPNRPAGGVLDDDYVKVYIDDALLMYYSNSIGVGDTIQTVAGELNQIRAAATSFKANGTAYPRDAALYDRDVQLGDAVKVRLVVGSGVYEFCSYIAGFVGEVIAAVIQAATADTANQDDDIAATSFSQTDGPDNCVDIESVDGAAYDGLEDGDVEETYTILVTQSSAGEDATTARLRVTSASGNDDDLVVTPAAFGLPTTIGSRGLTVTWNNTGTGVCSTSAVEEGYDVDDFLVGQEWEVVVAMNFDTVTATSGGDYTGAEDVTYIIEVTKGGLWADSPEITCTTDKGIDVSGPTIVTGAGVAVAVGTKGVTVSFDEEGLCKGDRFYIECDAEGVGAYQTLVLGHNFPQDVLDNGATESDLTLFIRKDIEVPEDRAGFAPLVNWVLEATQIILKSGITAYDASYTDDGTPLPMPVHTECDYSWVYVEARYWLSELCNEVNQIYNVSSLTDISGPLHPDNPLKYGVYKALQNSNGTPVSYTAVCDPDDVAEWTKVLELIDGRRDCYGLVPLTRNATVLGLYQGHTTGQSSPEFGRWRTCWFNLDETLEKVIVDDTLATDDEVVMATLEDDPNASGVQYTLLTVPEKNGQFIENGARSGDIVRFLYTTDGFGNELYTEFIIDSVISEDAVLLLAGHTVAVGVPQKIEIWRDLTETEQATELALTEGYNSRRVQMVWPNEIEADGYTVEGYFLCAALAGLASGVVPHQGLTQLEISGFTSVPQTTDKFNRSQLNIMASGGVWIVTQDLEDGDIFTRHAVTTGDYEDIAEREEQVTRNLDSMSFFFLDVFDPYIGISNVTPSTLALLRAETNAALRYLESNAFVPRLGSQLISGSLAALRAHATLKDRILISLDLVVPFPLNNIELHIRLVA